MKVLIGIKHISKSTKGVGLGWPQCKQAKNTLDKIKNAVWRKFIS